MSVLDIPREKEKTFKLRYLNGILDFVIIFFLIRVDMDEMNF